MRKALRQSVRTRYEFCCGYCGITEIDVGSELTIDHVQPQRHGGNDSLDNLVYCCHPCNEFKSKYWQTELDLRLLHPRMDDMAEHYREQEDGTLLALSERGANHIQTLHLNREKLIEHRLREQNRATQDLRYQEMQSLIAELRQEVADNKNTIGKVFGDPDA